MLSTSVFDNKQNLSSLKAVNKNVSRCGVTKKLSKECDHSVIKSYQNNPVEEPNFKLFWNRNFNLINESLTIKNVSSLNRFSFKVKLIDVQKPVNRTKSEEMVVWRSDLREWPLQFVFGELIWGELWELSGLKNKNGLFHLIGPTAFSRNQESRAKRSRRHERSDREHNFLLISSSSETFHHFPTIMTALCSFVTSGGAAV